MGLRQEYDASHSPRRSLALSQQEPRRSQAAIVLAGILRKRGLFGEEAWREAINLYNGSLAEVDEGGGAKDRALVRRRMGELMSR